MSPSGLSIVLDSSAYSHFRRGHEAVTDRIASAAAVVVPTIVLGELIAGFLLGNRRRANEQVLEEFLAEPFVTVMPVDRQVSQRYGELFTYLRRQGTPIPVNDIWIAACTLVAGATLITFDTDFDHVPHLPRSVLAR